MSRHINCAGCRRTLGEIRDAKLLKGIAYLCPDCETKRKAADLIAERVTKKRSPQERMYDMLDKYRG